MAVGKRTRDTESPEGPAPFVKDGHNVSERNLLEGNVHLLITKVEQLKYQILGRLEIPEIKPVYPCIHS